MTETHRAFDARFTELTSRWNAHQDLRRAEASVADLAASRERLDAARADVRSIPAA